MKRDPKQQLIALLEGLGLPRIIEGKSMLAHLESSPKELKETGEMVGRLACIGMDTVNKTWEEKEKEVEEKEGEPKKKFKFLGFGKN